jgi:hypothetical protein
MQTQEDNRQEADRVARIKFSVEATAGVFASQHPNVDFSVPSAADVFEKPNVPDRVVDFYL